MNTLKNIFVALPCLKAVAPTQVEQLWTEIAEAYSSENRYYHNLKHLSHLNNELLPLNTKFKNLDAVTLALFYHDIVYKSTKSNNESKSAELAKERLQKHSIHASIIEKCVQIIEATAKHENSIDQDINYFTDADLSILGSDETSYFAYTAAIRQEYAIYPDLLYKPGRKKVIQHFLAMKTIFKTDYFKAKYEAQARVNLKQELLLL